jgi:tetrapyrrole methylase family protein/MazG family protein
MIRRHPHVWGDVDVNGDPSQVTTNWEDIKKAEKAEAGDTRESILDGIPKASPSLFVAHKYQHKAAKVGFDWDNIRGVEEKAKEEFNEILTAESDEHRAEEITDLMFVLVNWLRWLGIDDPESHMRQINAKFYRRFTYVEQQATQNNKAMTDYSLEELDAWWHEAKSKGL